MKKKKKRTSSGQKWLGMFFYTLIGVASGILIMRYLEQFMDHGFSVRKLILLFIPLLLCVYAAMLVQIIIHEAGHLVFGLISGYRFSSFRIFNWMWIRQDGRLHIRRLSIAGTGGQCLMEPPDLQDGKMPVLLYNFGGAIMNLIASAVCFGLSFLFSAESVGSLVFLIMTVIGIAFAIMNGVPLHFGPVDNDGCNALSLMRSKEATRAFWIQMKASHETSRGVRLRDMPEEWFAVPDDQAMSNNIIATVGVLAFNRLMDEHHFDNADTLAEHLLSIESGIAGLYRSLITCDRIFMELIRENRTQVLDAFMTKEQKKLMKAMKSFPSVLRTEYAYALLAGHDAEKAHELEMQFERCAATYPYPAEIDGEKELMEIARSCSEQNPNADHL